jgi:hypothetical protein
VPSGEVVATGGDHDLLDELRILRRLTLGGVGDGRDLGLAWRSLGTRRAGA